MNQGLTVSIAGREYHLTARPNKNDPRRIWYFWYWQNGKRTCRSTKCRQKRKAIRAINNMDASIQFENAFLPISSIQEWARIYWHQATPREQLAIVFVFNKGICHYCRKQVHLKGRVGEVGARATIDHVQPIIGGGPDIFENTILACQSCNSKKSCESVGTFKRRREIEISSFPSSEQKGPEQDLVRLAVGGRKENLEIYPGTAQVRGGQSN